GRPVLKSGGRARCRVREQTPPCSLRWSMQRRPFPPKLRRKKPRKTPRAGKEKTHPAPAGAPTALTSRLRTVPPRMALLPSYTQTLPTHRDREKIGKHLFHVKQIPVSKCFYLFLRGRRTAPDIRP